MVDTKVAKVAKMVQVPGVNICELEDFKAVRRNFASYWTGLPQDTTDELLHRLHRWTHFNELREILPFIVEICPPLTSTFLL